MLDLYGAPGEVRDAIARLSREVDKRDWWADFSGVFNGPYVALEDAAVEISEWAPLVIPGLLQTPEYAQAVRREANEDSPPDSWLRARMSRQLVLTRLEPPPARLHAVIGEEALRLNAGGPDVMQGQLERLLSDAKRPHVTVQILPTGSGGHPGLSGSFSVLGLGDLASDVVFVDSAAGDMYVENQFQVGLSRLAFDRIARLALPSEASADLIATIIRSDKRSKP
ncbi:hypothetical protein GCM10022221_36590 [Actinocorallia aurea]